MQVSLVGKVCSARHTYASEGDFNVVVRVRDSSGRTTQTFEQITIRELGTPGIQGRGVIAAGTDSASALMFRLSAPLALKPGASTPFSFRLLGRTGFKGEQLDRVTHEGNTVRLEGRGKLDGKAGYRFVIDAGVADASGATGPGRLSVRITGADPAGTAQRAMFEAGGTAGPDAVAASVRHGSIQLVR